jgi:dGTPase
LEAQLIDFADEIAYNTADLDDAHSAGMLSVGEIAEGVSGYREILDVVEFQFPAAGDRVQFLEALRALINVLVTGLVEGTAENCLASSVATVESVRSHSRRLAGLTAPASVINAGLKSFLHRAVYQTPALVKERERSAAMIASLFGYFLKHPEQMPEVYAELARTEPRHRVVCDYVAGMTDGFCLRTVSALGLVEPGLQVPGC